MTAKERLTVQINLYGHLNIYNIFYHSPPPPRSKKINWLIKIMRFQLFIYKSFPKKRREKHECMKIIGFLKKN